MNFAGGIILLAALAFGAAHSSRAETLAEKFVKHSDMLHKWPCINVMTLQDEFSRGEADSFELALSWHGYAQGVADVLYPNEDKGFAFAMAALFKSCLENPTTPMSEIGKSLVRS